MDSFETDLEKDRRHVTEAQALVARQQGLLAELTAYGHDTEAAQQTLATFEQTPTEDGPPCAFRPSAVSYSR